jgi:hypothetical protein
MAHVYNEQEKASCPRKGKSPTCDHVSPGITEGGMHKDGNEISLEGTVHGQWLQEVNGNSIVTANGRTGNGGSKKEAYGQAGKDTGSRELSLRGSMFRPKTIPPSSEAHEGNSMEKEETRGQIIIHANGSAKIPAEKTEQTSAEGTPVIPRPLGSITVWVPTSQS